VREVSERALVALRPYQAERRPADEQGERQQRHRRAGPRAGRRKDPEGEGKRQRPPHTQENLLARDDVETATLQGDHEAQAGPDDECEDPPIRGPRPDPVPGALSTPGAAVPVLAVTGGPPRALIQASLLHAVLTPNP
jgi:hypothetical protein